MPFIIKRDNIIKTCADAIVNPTDCFYSGSGGTDYTIHNAAGYELNECLEECKPLNVGEVCVTDSFGLKNCRYIFHTVGPRYIDGQQNEYEQLVNCYKNVLNKAKELGLESIAFPLISSGTYRFPKGQALKAATSAITDFLIDNDMKVILLVYSNDAFDNAKKLFVEIEDLLGPYQFQDYSIEESISRLDAYECNKTKKRLLKPSDTHHSTIGFIGVAYGKVSENADIPSEVFEPDESFSDYIRRLLKEKNLEDADVYRKCNMDRRVFNRIKNDAQSRVKKETAAAIAIGFRLDIEETKKLLDKAGYSLSDSIVFDRIIKYCITNKIYDIFDINEILFSRDQKTLGC